VQARVHACASICMHVFMRLSMCVHVHVGKGVGMSDNECGYKAWAKRILWRLGEQVLMTRHKVARAPHSAMNLELHLLKVWSTCSPSLSTSGALAHLFAKGTLALILLAHTEYCKLQVGKQ